MSDCKMIRQNISSLHSHVLAVIFVVWGLYIPTAYASDHTADIKTRLWKQQQRLRNLWVVYKSDTYGSDQMP